MRRFVAVALVLWIPVAAQAQRQLGTVTSSSPFELRGANVNPAPGVPNWPVASGDTFQAGNAPLTLTLSDGSTVVFAPHSRATVSAAGSGPTVRLESGSARYTLQGDPNAINFYCKNDKSSVTSRTGDLDCGREATTAKEAFGAFAAGMLAAMAIVLSLENGPSVSPVRCGGVGLPSCP
jgi:hypothetical protein